MPDCRKGILQREGRAPRLGNHLHSPPLYSVNQYNDVLHQSTRFYSEFWYITKVSPCALSFWYVHVKKRMNHLFQATLSYQDPLSLASSLPGDPTHNYLSDSLTINQQYCSLIFADFLWLSLQCRSVRTFSSEKILQKAQRTKAKLNAGISFDDG